MVLCGQKYNRFDAYNDRQIAELKVRKHARFFGYEILYIVGTKRGIHVFNITDLDISNYDYRWEWREMPSNTEFGNGELMKKLVGYIDWGMGCLEAV